MATHSLKPRTTHEYRRPKTAKHSFHCHLWEATTRVTTRPAQVVMDVVCSHWLVIVVMISVWSAFLPHPNPKATLAEPNAVWCEADKESYCPHSPTSNTNSYGPGAMQVLLTSDEQTRLLTSRQSCYQR